jgi:elongation factor Tu
MMSLSASSQETYSGSFSMKIMDAFSITGRGTVVTGRVSTGSLVSGDTVCVPLISGETVARKVDGIELFQKVLERAEAGKMAGILVQDVDSKAVKRQGDLTTKCKLEVIEDAT